MKRRALRERLAIKAFTSTAEYDRLIANFSTNSETVACFPLELPLEMRLRYGENPHQDAATLWRFRHVLRETAGKGAFPNNILDISAATKFISKFAEPTVAIPKHTNRAALADPDLRKAWEKAFATDKQAPFGGIIVCNRPVTVSLAKVISEIFSEVIIAPEFNIEARTVLQKKKNLRLIRLLTPPKEARPTTDLRSVCGGLLVQDADVDGELSRTS